MSVKDLITAGFGLAASRQTELHEQWTRISIKIGGLLPNSLLDVSIQTLGRLDMVIRCMEDEFSVPSPASEIDMSYNYQSILSDLWIGSAYEIFRLLKARELQKTIAFNNLEHDLKLLRIPIEKLEIANDQKLKNPLLMQKYPPNNDETDNYQYAKNDNQKAHIMPSSTSVKGSKMWHVLDIINNNSYWLERRELSERVISLWGNVAADEASMV